MNHTPGPWKVSIINDAFDVHAEQVRVETDDSEERFVARCNPYQHVTEEDIANAKLLAAAPEMFEALKEFQRPKEGKLKDSDYISVLGRQINKARAIISKIERS